MTSSAHAARRISTAAVLLCTGALAAACGSTPSGNAAGGPASTPATASSSASAAASSAPPTTGTTTPAMPPSTPSAPPCSTADLSAAVNTSPGGAAAGSTYYPMNFTNTSKSSCYLYGYPGVSFVTAGSGSGKQIGAAAQRSTAFAKLAVRLGPGSSAHAWLKVTVAANYPASACDPVTADWLKVYPPEETGAGYVSQTFSACGSASAPLLTILPVRAGRGAVGVTP